MENRNASALIFNGKDKPIEKNSFPLPVKLSDYEVLVSISLSTVCGSDVHTWLGHRSFPTPSVMGHEMVGVIEDIGSKVTTDYLGNKLTKGDRIIWSMTVGCGNCFFCNNGLPQKCHDMFKYGHSKSDAQSHFTGGFAEYIILKKGSCIFKVPSDITDDEAAPLMCAGATVTSGLEIANFQPCDYIVIQGCGALGLYACSFTKELGAKKVIAIDTIEKRLELAKLFGADFTINAKKVGEQLVQEVMEITNGNGADYVVEMTGDPKVITQGIKILRIGGKYILLGAIYPENFVTIDSSEIITKCIQIFGMHNYHPKSLQSALNLVQKTRTKFPYSKLVGPVFQFSSNGLEDAFNSLNSKDVIRPALKPNSTNSDF